MEPGKSTYLKYFFSISYFLAVFLWPAPGVLLKYPGEVPLRGKTEIEADSRAGFVRVAQKTFCLSYLLLKDKIRQRQPGLLLELLREVWTAEIKLLCDILCGNRLRQMMLNIAGYFQYQLRGLRTYMELLHPLGKLQNHVVLQVHDPLRAVQQLTLAIEKQNVPGLMMSDGPHGLRCQAGETDMIGINESLPATCFPTAVTAGAT